MKDERGDEKPKRRGRVFSVSKRGLGRGRGRGRGNECGRPVGVSTFERTF